MIINDAGISQNWTLSHSFSGHGDVGNNVKSGFAIYNPKNHYYKVPGIEHNIWLDHDEFHYLLEKIAWQRSGVTRKIG